MLNHPIPNFLGEFDQSASVGNQSFSESFDLPNVSPIDIDEALKKEINQTVKPSDLFKYDFLFDRKAGVAKSANVKFRDSKPETDYSSKLSNPNNLLKKLAILSLEESFETFAPKVTDLSLPDNLSDFVLNEFPLDVSPEVSNHQKVSKLEVINIASNTKVASSTTVPILNNTKSNFFCNHFCYS